MTSLPSGTYDNPYFHDNVYGHTVELLRRHITVKNHDCIHLDIGCGYARIAEPLIESLGVHYVGLDGDDTAIASVRERGLEVHAFRLDDEQATYDTLKHIVGGRRVGSISMLDTLEHLVNGDATLRAIHKLAAEHSSFVVISVPNVTHTDIALKLAFGEWSYTDVGLLDHTHVRLFSRPFLRKVFRAAGLHEIDSYDVRKHISDQHFPRDHPALASGTLLHRFLYDLRQNVDDAGDVHQFVQLCVPGPRSEEVPYVTMRELQRPFLSIVTRTLGTRIHTLCEIITSLAAQTDDDFELLVVAHCVTLERQKLIERVIDDFPAWLREKIRIILVDVGNRTRPLNVGFEAARGHYIAILDDDDVPMANWVGTFKDLATSMPGRMLRTVAVRQNVTNVTVGGHLGLRAIGPLDMMYPSTFDFIQHLRINLSPPVAIAFPRGVFHDLNVRFDETLTTTEDWDYIMRVAGLVGVASSEEVTCIYRWWLKEDSSRTAHPEKEWQDNHNHIFQKMDKDMVLFPQGTTARIRILLDENDQMKAILRDRGIDFFGQASFNLPQSESRAELLRQIDAVLNSTSWKISTPIRALGYMLGKPKTNMNMVRQLQVDELAAFYRQLHASRSWRMTAPLRYLRRKRLR